MYEFFEVSAQKNNFLEPEKCFFAKPSFSEFHESSVEKTIFRSLKNCFSAEPCLWLTFLAILAIVVVVEALIFRKVFKDCLAQSAARWATALGSIPGAALFAEVLGKQCSRSDCEQSKLARKKHFSELEKLIFCKASVFFKFLKKTIFQVPKSTHILILCGLEAVQACAKKKIGA